MFQHRREKKEEIKEILEDVEADSKFILWNDNKSDVALGSPKLIEGKRFVEEEFLGFKFLFGPLSFMQPNPWQAEKIYGFVKEIADLRGKEEVTELYGGVGVIGILLAENSEKVLSVEENKEASKISLLNAKINGIKNYEALNKKAEEIEVYGDVLIVDPPRSGLHPKVIRKILENRPKEIIYVSCNPKTAWRDIQLLNYKIEVVKPFDMLPHTPHIELVIKLLG